MICYCLDLGCGSTCTKMGLGKWDQRLPAYPQLNFEPHPYEPTFRCPLQASWPIRGWRINCRHLRPPLLRLQWRLGPASRASMSSGFGCPVVFLFFSPERTRGTQRCFLGCDLVESLDFNVGDMMICLTHQPLCTGSSIQF